MFTTSKEEKEETKLSCWKQYEGNYFTGDAAVEKNAALIKI